MSTTIHSDHAEPDLRSIDRRLDHWERVEQGGDGQSPDEADATFREAYPEFAATQLLDELRTSDYGRLDAQDHVYLDYTGGNLYAESQLNQHMALLKQNVFGNPHSVNPTSLAMTHLVESARAAVFRYFNMSPEEYIVVFTPNASGALKLVGESYPFASGGHYLLSADNHNSVNGIREFVRAKHARVSYAPVVPPDLHLDSSKLEALLDQAAPRANNLFAYPAQSNFSGVQHSLEWIARAQAKGWDVLLDAAAFTPSNRLDLSQWQPDFVSLSFYKIFGYPTGVGALLARKAVLPKLQRPWFAGGTITLASVLGDGHFLADGEAAFEDGTVNYLSLPAVEIGLNHITRIGIDLIHTRAMCLAEWLLNDLTALRHSNRAPLARIYGPTDTRQRGASIALNFYDRDRRLIPFRHIEAEASRARISLRTGCFCNPGAGETAHGFSEAELQTLFRDEDRMTYEEFMQVFDNRSTGSVRISLGIASTFKDVYRFAQFARRFLDHGGHAA